MTRTRTWESGGRGGHRGNEGGGGHEGGDDKGAREEAVAVIWAREATSMGERRRRGQPWQRAKERKKRK
ncbi:hypothetical protein SESBI_19068 [Sesbania bispinosa]|nr:hypothetical protein SESBI_19068 [Sesbania bispinosa]